jgi:hypothetical protein
MTRELAEQVRYWRIGFQWGAKRIGREIIKLHQLGPISPTLVGEAALEATAKYFGEPVQALLPKRTTK